MTPATRFVGRAAELARIGALLDRCTTRGAGALLVLAAPGVGKTRLLAQAAQLAARRGARAATVSCLPLTTVLPFDPLLGLLQSLGVPLGVAPTARAGELFGAVADRLAALTAGRPVLLCVDDLQWCDLGTLELIGDCLGRQTKLPIGWVLAARSTPDSGATTDWLEHVELFDRLELGPLSSHETRQLAQAVLGSERVSDQLVEALFRRAGGNPLLSEQLLRALAAAAHGHDDSAALATLVPDGVIAAVSDVVDRLDPTLRDALEWATVLPAVFTSPELAAVTDSGTVGGAAESLHRAGFLTPAGADGWTFVHELVRDAIYRALYEGDRVRRHAAVADVLAAGPVSRLAPQLASAHRWDDAARAYCRLADTALARGLAEDSARLYGRSAALADNVGERRLAWRARSGRVLALLRAGAEQDADQQGPHSAAPDEPFRARSISASSAVMSASSPRSMTCSTATRRGKRSRR